MKRKSKLFVCLCFTLVLFLLFCLTHTAALEPPQSDRMELHSWEELGRLYVASKTSNDAFLAQLSALDEECDRSTGGHLNFELAHSSGGRDNYKDEFVAYYEQIANLKILVPIDADTISVETIILNSYGGDISQYNVSYQIQYEGEKFCFYTAFEKDYSVTLSKETGEPITQMSGDGYSVEIYEREYGVPLRY